MPTIEDPCSAAPFDADHGGATVRPSPNFGERKNGLEPTMVVLHYTGMESGIAAENWLCNPQSEVSAHYLVYEDGSIVQMVPENKRAWHAGQGVWRGKDDINSRSIGIEIVNGGHEFGSPDFPLCQIETVCDLLAGILTRHNIELHNVIAHSDMAPSRKCDPGEKFPWKVLADRGLALWVEPEPVSGGRFFSPGEEGQPIRALQSMLGICGYNQDVTGVFDEPTKRNIIAFQRRQRPARVDGIADMSTIETLHRFLQIMPLHDEVENLSS